MKPRYPGQWRLIRRDLVEHLIYLDGGGRPPTTFSYLAPVYVVSETRTVARGRQEYRERHEIGAALYVHDMSSEQAVLFRSAAAAVDVLRRVAVARSKRGGKPK